MTEHLPASVVARVLGIKTATLAKWRRQGRGPAGWFHVSSTLVVYPANAVEEFVQRRRTDSGV